MDGLMTKVYHKKCGNHIGYTDDVSASKSDVGHFFTISMQHLDKMVIGCKCGEYVHKDGMGILTIK